MRRWLAALLLLIPMAAGAQEKPVPVRQGLIWSDTLNITVDDCANENYKLLPRESATIYLAADAAVFTDDTTDFNDAGANDITIWPATPAVNDAIYFGHSRKFEQIEFTIGTSGSTVMTVAWEYYSSISSGWKTLTFTQQSIVDFDEAAGTYVNHWTPPLDWAKVSVNSLTAGWWIRARVSAYTSVTTQALGTQGWHFTEHGGEAKQVVISSDTDETENLWCEAGSDEAAVDTGFVWDATSQALTVEVETQAGEIRCCGDGGAVDIQVMLMRDR